MLRTEHLSTTTADPDRVHDLRPRTSRHTGEEAHPAWAADLPTPASKIWAAFRLQRADFAPAVVCWPPASPVPPSRSPRCCRRSGAATSWLRGRAGKATFQQHPRDVGGFQWGHSPPKAVFGHIYMCWLLYGRLSKSLEGHVP